MKQFAAWTAIISNLSPWHLTIEGQQRKVSTSDFWLQDKDPKNVEMIINKMKSLKVDQSKDNDSDLSYLTAIHWWSSIQDLKCVPQFVLT